VSGSGTLQIDLVRCADAAGVWRASSETVRIMLSDVIRRCDTLFLDDWLTVAPTIAPELSDELDQAATLLDNTVEAVRLVGFDVTATSLAGELLSGTSALIRSLDDAVGASRVDLDDPDPLNGELTAHFGYIPLFGDGGPLPTDVNQGSLGDCWLLAVMAATANGDPARLQSMIHDNRDGTYTVTIDGHRITVDDEFPVDANGLPTYARGPQWTQPTVLWPLILEKAMAQHVGGDYDDLSGDDPERAHDWFGGTDEMSISQWLWTDPSDAEVLDNSRVCSPTGARSPPRPAGRSAWAARTRGRW
jgi:hypothetical protein